MPDDQPSPPPGASSSAPEFGDRRLGRPGVAWTFILLMVAGLVALPFIQPDRARTTSEEDLDKVAIRVMQKQAKLFAAAVAEERQDDPDASPPPFLVGQAEALNAGGVEQRLRYAILAYELKGPKAAREALDEVGRIIEQRGDDAGDGRPEDAEYPADDRRTLAILQTLYAEENVTTGDRDGKTWPLPGIDALSESQRALLQEELGWFGELALDPTATWSEDEVEALQDEVVPMVVGMIMLLGFILLAGFSGLVGLVIALVLAFLGRLRSRLGPRAPHAGVYAETFAVWMVVFFGLQMFAAPMVGGIAPDYALLGVFVAFFLSLIALAWPVARGVPWSRVRSDIGLTAGERPALEPAVGAAGYAMMLPIVAIGLGLTFLLIQIVSWIAGGSGDQEAVSVPVHPILGEVLGDTSSFFQILLLAAVAAPVVEEIAFRGVLYRQLRDGTRPMGTGGSIVVSGLVSAVIFAIIHPEGALAAPAKASIGFSLALLREWRGTLIPAIIVHAINNGLLLIALRILLGG